MTRTRLLGAAFALLLLTAACGDDGAGEAEGASEPDDAVETTVPDDDEGDDEGDDEEGDGDEGDGSAAGLCERLTVEDVSAATGLVLDEVGPQFSQMTGDGFDVTATGCSFEGEGDADVEVVLLDADHDPDATFEVLFDASATSSFDDFPHAEVDGLGDAAFFEAGLRQEELAIRVGETVLFVEGTGIDGETLGRAELQAVAELALAAVG